MKTSPSRIRAKSLAVFGSLVMMAAFAAPKAVAVEELVLDFTTETKSTKHASDKSGKPTNPPPETTKGKMTVGLGDNYFYVNKGDQKRLYRFDTRRVLTADATKKENADCSLYAYVGFRAMELANRLVMRKALIVLQDKSVSMGDDIQLETLFAMPIPKEEGGSKTIIDAKGTRDGGTAYSVKGKVLATFKPGAALDTKFKPMFSKFLIYECSLAPQLRLAIEGQNKLPAAFHYRVNNPPFEERQETLTLVGSKTGTGGLPSIVSAKCSDIPQADKSKMPTREAWVAFAQQREKDNNFLDAFLGIMECQLSTDIEVTDALRNLKAGLEKDTRAATVFSSLTPHSEEAAKAAQIAFEKLDRTGLQKAYLLDIIQANLITSLGKGSDAIKLMTGVLEQHPYITGAYIDLGKLYYASYQTSKAWDCWDQARKIAPNHRMLKDVDALQTGLEQQYPEYF